MLDSETKRKIDTARDILVGKVPDPKSQVEQITIALIYKFMDDMDLGSEELGGERSFFRGEFEKYAWRKIFDPRMGGFEILNLYSEAILKMNINPDIPQLFRDIFKNAYLPYRDPETLKAFLKVINEFSYDHSEKLGDAFEYLLSVLGSQGEAGQFRTPRHIIDFMVAIMDPKKDEVILDPACGTAGFLISSYKHIIKNNSSNYNPDTDIRMFETKDLSLSEIVINSKNYKGDKLTPEERNRLANNIKGYDISPDMVRLSLVNMYLHGLHAPHIYEYDTLTSEDHWNEYADVILANPPFMSPKGGIRPHKRFSISSSRSEVLFVDYIAGHLTPNGRAAVIVPEGIIFQSGKAYKSLRKMLVENCLVGVISLPAGVFNPYSGVKTSILWLDRTLAKKTDKILFVKIENDGFDLGAQRRAIKRNDLPDAYKLISHYKNQIIEGDAFYLDEETKYLMVPRIEVAGRDDFNLSAERYKLNKKVNSEFHFISIGEVAQVIAGQSPKGKYYNENGVGIPFYQGKTEFGTITLGPPKKWTIQVTKEAIPGDILISVRAPVGPVNFTNQRICIGRGLAAIRCKETITRKYLFYILRSKEGSIKGNGGAVFDSITRKQIEEIQIPLPPLSVQEEIVAEIESYQKIIDGARQVVENYKPRIDIDPAWPMVELGELCENLDYKRRPVEKSNRKAGPYPYYGASGIVDYVDSYIFEGDFLLLSEDGANLLARSTPIAFSISGKNWVNNHAHILKFESIVTQKYVEKYLNQKDLKTYITGMAQPKLNQAAMNKIPIPTPPIDIQKEIVDIISVEESAIAANYQLIKSFEQKIKDRIARVWGEK